MNENKSLGETFINGRLINLDAVSVSDLERYISEVEKNKEIAMVNFNRIVDEIRSN